MNDTTDRATMREIATIVDDWRIGEVTDRGARERIGRLAIDEAPVMFRDPNWTPDGAA